MGNGSRGIFLTRSNVSECADKSLFRVLSQALGPWCWIRCLCRRTSVPGQGGSLAQQQGVLRTVVGRGATSSYFQEVKKGSPYSSLD